MVLSNRVESTMAANFMPFVERAVRAGRKIFHHEAFFLLADQTGASVRNAFSWRIKLSFL